LSDQQELSDFKLRLSRKYYKAKMTCNAAQKHDINGFVAILSWVNYKKVIAIINSKNT